MSREAFSGLSCLKEVDGEVATTGTRKCGPESLNNPGGMVVVGHPAFLFSP
jgi:hypothetical protein